MDFSNENFLMCLGATELQELWVKQIGDIFFEISKFNIGQEIRPFYYPCVLLGTKNRPILQGVYDDGLIRLEARSLTDKVFLTEVEESKMHWMPRQDQLQNLCIYMGGVMNIPSLQRFMDFVRNQLHEDYSKFVTLEQYWLAYYMMSKHFKDWNGTNWVTMQR
jgi:hypothetical protein